MEATFRLCKYPIWLHDILFLSHVWSRSITWRVFRSPFADALCSVSKFVTSIDLYRFFVCHQRRPPHLFVINHIDDGGWLQYRRIFSYELCVNACTLRLLFYLSSRSLFVPYGPTAHGNQIYYLKQLLCVCVSWVCMWCARMCPCAIWETNSGAPHKYIRYKRHNTSSSSPFFFIRNMNFFFAFLSQRSLTPSRSSYFWVFGWRMFVRSGAVCARVRVPTTVTSPEHCMVFMSASFSLYVCVCMFRTITNELALRKREKGTR